MAGKEVSSTGGKKLLTSAQFCSLITKTDSTKTFEAEVKLRSASTESSGLLRAERKAGQQMGRRGQGEMANAKVSSDAMPALTGRRCVGTVIEAAVFSANKVVPQKCIFCPCSLRGTRTFCLFGNDNRFLERSICYVEEITRKAMAKLTISLPFQNPSTYLSFKE